MGILMIVFLVLVPLLLLFYASILAFVHNDSKMRKMGNSTNYLLLTAFTGLIGFGIYMLLRKPVTDADEVLAAKIKKFEIALIILMCLPITVIILLLLVLLPLAFLLPTTLD